MIGFKPNLFPNEKVNLDLVKFPMNVLDKLDGIRCIFMGGLMLSRSLKKIPNKQLQEKFKNLKEFTEKNNVILDGEIYGDKMTFQEITSITMSDDKEVPEKLKFFCFDAIINQNPNQPFSERHKFISELKLDNLVTVKQKLVNSKDEVTEMFSDALERGFEGLILRNPNSKYKFGRISPNSGDGYKVKPWITYDSKIIDIEQRFNNLNESQKNELGHSFKRDTIDAKEATGIAACFVVEYNGQTQKVTITGIESFRKEIWSNKEKYIGKTIEWKGMEVGSVDKIRHPVFVRFRQDK